LIDDIKLFLYFLVKQINFNHMSKLKNSAPELSKIKKELPFGVPPNYFDDFYARLHVRIEAAEGVRPKPGNRMIRLLKPALAMAASFTLIFMLVYWPIKSFLPGYLAKTNTSIDSTLEDETLIAILNTMDEQSFISLLNEANGDQKGNNSELSDEELISCLTAQASDYEIFLQTSN